MTDLPRASLTIYDENHNLIDYSGDPNVNVTKGGGMISVEYKTTLSTLGFRNIRISSIDNDGDQSSGDWGIKEDKNEDSENQVNINSPSKSDKPDDNEDVSYDKISSVDLDCTSKIALLRTGLYNSFADLLSDMGISFDIVSPNFLPDMINKYPVLLIPSGGLTTFRFSELAKNNFQKYVSKGGTLIVLSQPLGTDFSILPGEEITAEGWSEDQSCFDGSVSVPNIHPIVSGIDIKNINMYVDGFFKKIPKNSVKLLTRTINGNPAAFTYDYDKGRVFVSTLYMDWGSTVGQITAYTRKLLRDLISWGVKNEGEIDTCDINEISPSYQIELNNNTSQTVKKIVLTTYLPNIEKSAPLISYSESREINISPSSQQKIDYVFLGDQKEPGIWNVDCKFYDENNALLKTDEKIFQVAFCDKTNLKKVEDIQAGLSTDKEEYYKGENSKVSIYLKNNTNNSRSFTVYLFNSNSPFQKRSIVTSLNPNEEKEITENLEIIGISRITLAVYSEGVSYFIPRVVKIKSIPIFKSSDNSVVNFTKDEQIKSYFLGGIEGVYTGNFLGTLQITKNGQLANEFEIPIQKKYDSETSTTKLIANFDYNSITKNSELLGILETIFTIKEIKTGEVLCDKNIIFSTKSEYYKILTTGYDYTGSTLTSYFKISNNFLTSSPEAKLIVALDNQDQSLSISKEVNIIASPGKEVVIPIIFNNIDFNSNYKINANIVTLNDQANNSTYNEIFNFSNNVKIESSLKSKYKNGESISSNIYIKNSKFSNFAQTINCQISEIGFALEKNISILPGEIFNIPIETIFEKEKMIYGTKYLTVELKESNQIYKFPLSVFPAKIDLIPVSSELHSGENYNFTLSNIGDLWADFELNICLQDKTGKIIKEEKRPKQVIKPAESQLVSFQILDCTLLPV